MRAPTYRQIQEYVKSHSGFAAKTCWIAHVKELHGLPVRRAWNRSGQERAVPCPPDKRPAIEQAFRHFGAI